MVSGFDEDSVVASDTQTLVAKLADLKARTVGLRVEGPALILGCDSLLDVDGESLGKPASDADAIARWRRLRGRVGQLWTGHCLIDTASDRTLTRAAVTTVRFADVSDAEIELYVSTGEASAVAGAFTVDALGGWFVEAVDGDHHNVVGLSLPLLRRMLLELGYQLTDVGYPAR